MFECVYKIKLLQLHSYYCKKVGIVAMLSFNAKSFFISGNLPGIKTPLSFEQANDKVYLYSYLEKCLT